MKELLCELMQNSADNGQPVWDWEPGTVDEFADADTEQMAEAIKEIHEEMNDA